jgi:hypothetical protein
MAIFQMTIDCDVPAKLQLEEEVLVESLLSALIRKALKDEGVECRGVVCERLDDVNPLEWHLAKREYVAMITVTVWVVMATSTWSYEGAIHEQTWPTTKPVVLYLSKAECEKNKPVNDYIPTEEETPADVVTFFECASMQLDASQLKTLAK